MSCSTKRIEELIKEVEDQRVKLANNINELESSLSQSKNSYMKVLGAAEVLQIQLKEAQEAAEKEEDSGD